MEYKSEGHLGTLPIEIIVNILLRLAFKDLVSLKCVSKSLSTLISIPEIANSYLKQSLDSLSNRPFLFFKEITACYSIQLDKLEKLDLANKVHHRLVHGVGVGSCNGLVCVWSGQTCEILYNPSTREWHEIPPSPVGRPNSMPQGVDDIYHRVKYGFGYDSAGGDYKVLKIFAFYSSINHVAFAYGAMMYSLKNNSWRNITFPGYVDELESDYGVLCNETLHWVYRAQKGSSVEKGIIGFELHSEMYHHMPLPDHVDISDISLGTLDGCLCLSFHVKKLLGGSDLQVWVMKEYGVKECWSFLFGISNDRGSSITRFRPIAYSESGDEVLVDYSSTHFLWFDLRLKKIKCYLPCHHSGAVICHQSIASPQSLGLNVQASSISGV